MDDQNKLLTDAEASTRRVAWLQALCQKLGILSTYAEQIEALYAEHPDRFPDDVEMWDWIYAFSREQSERAEHWLKKSRAKHDIIMEKIHND